MCRMDVVLWIPWTIVVIFDVLRLDLDVHVVELGMVVIVCTPVTVDHGLS